MIYFIQSGESGPIKIGQSLNPKHRLIELQTSHPDELQILGVMQGGQQEEVALHRRFAEFHMRGEWFRPGEALMMFIRFATVPYLDTRHFRRRANAQIQTFEERKAAAENGTLRDLPRRPYGPRRFTMRSPRLG